MSAPLEVVLPGAIALDGTWQAVEADEELRRGFASRDIDESNWEPLEVPGHWRSSTAFADCNGPVLYRRHFETDHTNVVGPRRSWLVLDGLFYQGDIWLDGAYVGDTEGYFVRHSFEITRALRETKEHVLAIEATCAPQTNRDAKRNLTGIFQHSDYLDPDWNPGGIWRPVRIEHTGPVRARGLRALCTHADQNKATVSLRAELDSNIARQVRLRTTIAGIEEITERSLAAGANFVTWTITIPHPALWWPHALGDQPLHALEVEIIVDDQSSHRLTRSIGLRSLRWKRWSLQVNGERLFLKGTNFAPTQQALGEASPQSITRDVELAKDAGLDLIRLHAHVSRPELYEACDQTGMLIWQDLPLHRGHARGTRHQAARQAVAAVDQLGHHPSIVLWCGHNEPTRSNTKRPETIQNLLRDTTAQQLPSWNRTILDRTIKRALDKADPSRGVIAHSGVMPHPGSLGGDTHLSFGWAYGEAGDFPAFCRAIPRLVRFVSEFGAQAIPTSDVHCEPTAWPDLDFGRLEQTYGMARAPFEAHMAPSDYRSFSEWQIATQDYQAKVIKQQIETLRRLKYTPTGGFAQFFFADARPAISSSVLDHERVPKSGYYALSSACRPVIVVADHLPEVLVPGEPINLDLHVVSDLRHPIGNARVKARISWQGGLQEWSWEGDIPADSCVRVGQIATRTPDEPGALTLELTLDASDLMVSNFDQCVVASTL